MTNRFRIHGPRGVVELAVEATTGERPPSPSDAGADQVSVSEIMSRRLICAFPDLSLTKLIHLMIRERLGCVPVVDDTGHPVGMVTKFDIVEHFEAPKPDALVEHVMMPLAITLDDNATVAHAAALMASEDMHHVMIVSDRRLIGVVSTMDVTRWLARSEGLAR